MQSELKDVRSRIKHLVERWLVEHLRLAPRFVGYRHFRMVEIDTAGKSRLYHLECKGVGTGDRRAVPSDRSCEQEPEGALQSSADKPPPDPRVCVATGRHITVYEYLDKWRNGFYLLTSDSNTGLQVPGTGFHNGHTKVLLSRSKPVRISRRCKWIFEWWSGNYYHWVVRHLPKILLLEEVNGLGDIVVPSGIRLAKWQKDSLIALGIDPAGLRTMSSQVCCFDELVICVVGGESQRLFRQLSARVRQGCGILNSRSPHRRLFISRKDAGRRRLTNEDEVIDVLSKYGFETVCFEALGFSEQVRLSAESTIMVATHGAGMTNILFANPGLSVVEICDSDMMRSHYSDLSLSMGHKYRRIPGFGVGAGEPAYRDLKVNVHELEREIAETLHQNVNVSGNWF